MNQPVRRENGRRRNPDESISRDVHILWKTSKLSSKRRCYIARFDRRPVKYGIIDPILPQAARLHGGFARSIFCARRDG
jgi:hypothetical protein